MKLNYKNITESAKNSIDSIREFDYLKLSLGYIGVWPFFLRVTVLCAIGIIMLAVFFFSYSTIVRVIKSSAVKQELDLRAKYQEVASDARNYKEYLQALEIAKSRLEDSIVRLPNTDQIAEFIEALNEISLNSGLIIKSIAPEASKKSPRSDAYKEIPIQINAVGNYHQFARFLEGIISLYRIVAIDTFEVTATDPNQPLRIIINATAYVYAKNKK